MGTSIFLLCLLLIPFTLIYATPRSRDYLLNCGSNDEIEEGALKYTTDDIYISTGNKTTLNRKDILPILQTLRFFANAERKKYCYNIPVIKGSKYLVKTIYFYGGFDGGDQPPVFDQIIDGTKWSVVNTTEDYAIGGTSFYEAIVMAQNKFLSVCLARNQHTTSSPFISSLEVHFLDNSVYNSTNLQKNMLVTVARTSFGSDEDLISSPDDNYSRYWQSFKDDNPKVASQSTINPSTFWNIPPEKALASALTTSRGATLTLNWPPFSLPSGPYYIALYFQDNRTPSPYSWRVFDIQVNGENFYEDVNVTASGVSVFGTDWPLGGKTVISLVPSVDAPVGPLINAGELFQILAAGNKTVTRDVVAMEKLRKSLVNVPEDWAGDPCLPVGNSWTGVSCSTRHPFRINSLNLTGFGVSGTLPNTISRLTALKHMLLGDNKISGAIPDLSALKSLEVLHLENNQFEGSIPESLGQLANLRELFLQNNKLNGELPESLANKSGITIRV